MRKHLFALLSGIFAVSATLLVVFFRGATQGTVAFETAKALLQLGVVAVVGAAVSWALTEYQLEQSRLDKARDLKRQEDAQDAELARQRYEYRDEFLTATLKRVVSAYASAKKARRLLRAHIGVGTGAPALVRITEYDHYLQILNEAQLDLESVKGDVRTSTSAFSNPLLIESDLENMEQYLGRVVKEYEEHRHLLAQGGAGLQLAKLTKLQDFLAKAKRGNGFKDFVIDPYHNVQAEIRNDLLHPRLPTPNQRMQRTSAPELSSGDPQTPMAGGGT